MIDGFSGHGDMDDLDEYISQIKENLKIFLVHGEDDQLYPFAERIKEKLILIHIYQIVLHILN